MHFPFLLHLAWPPVCELSLSNLESHHLAEVYHVTLVEVEAFDINEASRQRFHRLAGEDTAV